MIVVVTGMVGIDKKNYPDIKTAGKEVPYYTNSTNLPVDHGEDLFEVLQHQDELQCKYTGGTVLHGFLGEAMESGEACSSLVKKIANGFKLPYYTITPTFSICPVHGYVKGQHYNCPVEVQKKQKEVSKNVGSDFKYWIRHRLIFILVDQGNFKQIHSGPGWAGALNDGRIKIPVTGRYKDPKAFKSVLAHEYTHSVINALARGRGVAFWVHEGLAEYEEHQAGGRTPDFKLLHQAAKKGGWIPMSFLSEPGASQRLNSGQVTLAYQFPPS